MNSILTELNKLTDDLADGTQIDTYHEMQVIHRAVHMIEYLEQRIKNMEEAS